MSVNKRKAKNEARALEAFAKDYVRDLGRQGGKKRSQNLTPERRREIAAKAATTRWSNVRRKNRKNNVPE